MKLVTEAFQSLLAFFAFVLASYYVLAWATSLMPEPDCIVKGDGYCRLRGGGAILKPAPAFIKPASTP